MLQHKDVQWETITQYNPTNISISYIYIYIYILRFSNFSVESNCYYIILMLVYSSTGYSILLVNIAFHGRTFSTMKMRVKTITIVTPPYIHDAANTCQKNYKILCSFNL